MLSLIIITDDVNREDDIARSMGLPAVSVQRLPSHIGIALFGRVSVFRAIRESNQTALLPAAKDNNILVLRASSPRESGLWVPESVIHDVTRSHMEAIVLLAVGLKDLVYRSVARLNLENERPQIVYWVMFAATTTAAVLRTM